MRASILNPFDALEVVFEVIEGVFSTYLPALNTGLDYISDFLTTLPGLIQEYPVVLVAPLITIVGIRVVMNFF